MSSPCHRLIDDDLESMDAYARLVLEQPEAANPHVRQLAEIGCALVRDRRPEKRSRSSSTNTADVRRLCASVMC